ncbi:MAG: TonB family protein [Candidatus Binatia bacterium]
MSEAVMLGGENAANRQAVAFSVSVALHATFAILLLVLARVEPPPPIEISIFPGPPGPASPPPGEKSAEPGPVGPPPEEPKPVVQAPKPAPVAKAKPVAKPVTKAPPVARPVEDQGLLAALRKTGPAPTTQSFEGVESNVKLRQRPQEGEVSSAPLGSARAKADVVGTEIGSSGPAVTGSLGSGVGKVVLPGPGGGGSGWNSGAGGSGSGGGGTGRGGFSVSGAGAGGTGRSYGSIWEWTQRYLAGLRWAYNNELRNIPSLRGVMVVRYEILSNGAVGSVTMVSSQMKDPGLEQQVLSQIRGWHYPPEPAGTVVVTWPFSFLPPS